MEPDAKWQIGRKEAKKKHKEAQREGGEGGEAGEGGFGLFGRRVFGIAMGAVVLLHWPVRRV